MNATILTFGSRGDVEPYLALAAGLRREGHEINLVAPWSYHEWIASFGVTPRLARFDLGQFVRELEDEAARGTNPIKRLSRMRRTFFEGLTNTLDDFLDASGDADLVIAPGSALGALDIAAARGVPAVIARPIPLSPTRDFPSFMVPFRASLGGAYNRWTERLASRLTWRSYGPPLNKWRTSRLGLRPWNSHREITAEIRERGVPTLNLHSPAVVPRPHDWDRTEHVTGYSFLEPAATWTPDKALQDFLESGPAPVCVGFGSMPLRDPEQRTRAVLEALGATGQRGLVMTGGGGALTRVDAPDTVFFAESLPFHWLFPRMAAVIHHGGAGTTAAVLRAGVPGIILPHAIDQFAWAHQIEKLGVGLRGPALRRLDAKRLSALITQATGDAEMRERASSKGLEICAEDGVSRAVEVLQRYMLELKR